MKVAELPWRRGSYVRALLTLALILACFTASSAHVQAKSSRAEVTRRLVAAAVARSRVQVRYVPGYVAISYPGGDVPADTGVCADEIIRIYRAVGIDLQKRVHEDMSRNFGAYPKLWGARRPDPNIDHRRVPNLRVFFARHGEDLPITSNALDYLPGDVVTWDLGHGLVHVGMVVDQEAPLWHRRMILHNVGRGPQIEDVLFGWPMTGHYRYPGE